MRLLEVVRSSMDRTVKYVFDIRGQTVEFSYINKGDGKDIVCVPTQTSCRLGCKFCFLTGRDAPVLNLTSAEICDGVAEVFRSSELPKSRTLLISFMGAGEPLCNWETVIFAASTLRRYRPSYGVVRFALATIVPSVQSMVRFASAVVDNELQFKVHLSLHSPVDSVRSGLMPAATSVAEGVAALGAYAAMTGQPVEVHYTLIDGVNDSDGDAVQLAQHLDGIAAPVKFLAFKSGRLDGGAPSESVARFRGILESRGVKTEYYDPPGSDIGSSCGQFLVEIGQPRQSMESCSPTST